MRRENDFRDSGNESGLTVSSVLAVLVSDLVPGLSAEEAVEVVEMVDGGTDCQSFCENF